MRGKAQDKQVGVSGLPEFPSALGSAARNNDIKKKWENHSPRKGETDDLPEINLETNTWQIKKKIKEKGGEKTLGVGGKDLLWIRLGILSKGGSAKKRDMPRAREGLKEQGWEKDLDGMGGSEQLGGFVQVQMRKKKGP